MKVSTQGNMMSDRKRLASLHCKTKQGKVAYIQHSARKSLDIIYICPVLCHVLTNTIHKSVWPAGYSLATYMLPITQIAPNVGYNLADGEVM